MFGKLSKGGAVATALALAILGVGATPALAADGDVKTYAPGDAKLTKVIISSDLNDLTQDTYTYSFAGQGAVHAGVAANGEDPGKLYSADGVEQNIETLKIGDVIPAISDQELKGINLTTSNTLSNGQIYQAVVQTKLSDILGDVVFPHAGVYTYVVTESATDTKLVSADPDTKIYINNSQASYTLRVYVENDSLTDTSGTQNSTKTHISGVTLEKTINDDGAEIDAIKVDPTYPKVAGDVLEGKINETSEGVSPQDGTVAGDSRGRDVDGLTFANEYIEGGSFYVKKLVDGEYGDKTKKFDITVAIYDELALDPKYDGCVVTYQIVNGGIDNTEGNIDSTTGLHQKLTGVNYYDQKNDYMVPFNNKYTEGGKVRKGYAIIEATLKEGQYIQITGVFGPLDLSYADDPNSHGDYRMHVADGLKNGELYYVAEAAPGLYEPTGYEYTGNDSGADPRILADGMETTHKLTEQTLDPMNNWEDAGLPQGALLLDGRAGGGATTVFVVNTLDKSKVSPTGILINNLPYILMVGGPLAIFAIMFVSKRRRNAAA